MIIGEITKRQPCADVATYGFVNVFDLKVIVAPTDNPHLLGETIQAVDARQFTEGMSDSELIGVTAYAWQCVSLVNGTKTPVHWMLDQLCRHQCQWKIDGLCCPP